jgi:hypothetical protein
MWLGKKRGYLQDWLTQLWVKGTGRRIQESTYKWLLGPVGNTDKIGDTFIPSLCLKENLSVVKNKSGFGLMNSINEWELSDTDYNGLNKKVFDFYEHTTDYNFEVWSSWSGVFYPFGKLLNFFFSRRLQQLNLPLKPLDSSRGIESNIVKLFPEDSAIARYTIWYRVLKSKNDVIYSGLYSTTFLESIKKKCLKIVFPLPNGNATVIMNISVLPDGSLFLESKGRKFGHPGFYFTLTNQQGKFWAKYVKAMHETIKVYEDEEGVLRADHFLKIWGMYFLKLHYKMTKKNLISSKI